MKGKLFLLAVSACFSIMLCRFHFHPLLLLLTLTFLIFLLIKNEPFHFLFCFAVILIFITCYTITEFYNKTSLNEGPLTVNGIFSSIPAIDGNKYKGEIKTPSGERVTFSYMINSIKEKQAVKKINPGMSCQFKGKLIHPKSPTMPNAFNYKQYLQDQHIHWQYEVDVIKDCVTGKSNWLLSLLEIRKHGLSFIEEHFPHSSVGIVQALIYGEISLLDPKVEKAYQEVGIVHLLAISGSHVALLVSGIYYIFILSGLTHEKTKIILILLLPLYMILTGAAPSVIRACFMVMVYFFMKLCKWKNTTLDVISFTFICLLLLNPYYLFHIGFQLSFIVTYGLVLSFGIVENFSSRLMKLTVVSFIAQLCALPLLLFHFYEVSLISLPMNMLFVPLYSFIILPISILSTVTMAVLPSIGTHIIQMFDEFLQITHQIVLYASSIPFTTLTTGKPSYIILIALIITIYYLFLQLEQHQKLILPFRPTVYLTIVLITQITLPYINPNGQVMIIDVGQGDSIFIKRPFNKGNYLIDTGGRISFPKEEWEETRNPFSITKDVTLPYLKSIGVTKLDALILTHGDMDHIGEALPIIDEIRIKELILPNGFVRGELEQNIIQSANEKMLKIKSVMAGDIINFQDFSFYVLSPHVLTDSKNADSLVIWAELGGLKWLFTGDAEIESEKRFVQLYPSLKVDVLKVGHHGSKGSTSEQLLDKVRPEIALISAGYNNRYQHPHTEVLERLGNEKITVFRTDLHGGLLYQFKGKSGTFSIHPPYDEVSE
ncbi:DNA internalization-related competence protein ComEC/Rec2 [Metabacillus sediminilitoris]|uniref:DNA internalization-related competence protein ComEC/Rec2 n=1 Tax=Metabacillus sediminilitoris TaxID=2567941 RepID=A0A4S4BZH9_9BACI|nr:DNA internalization-related competence protein ComEC/Rec2 [Metabacillus sediminilitoris]QGQ47337.1 DNA internalization-related competence protein ComEC/Rec2 [Metabacillus sediminilitoris]THF80680.1 DNA internalization-related competence protein ComEC/Rec2 [Metabacillus sediminilitoris]